MRLALVTDAWSPQINGVVTTLTKTVAQLRNWGHEVLTITPDLFRTVPCPTYPDIRLALFPGRKMKRLLAEFEPDAIHIATEGSLGWAARAYCLRHKLAFTTSYHTRFPEYVRLRLPVPLSFTYALMKRFHGPAKTIMVATSDLADELHARGFHNLRLWSRGVDTDIFKPWGKNFLPGMHPIMIYVGRVAVEKNIEDFLKIETLGTKYVIGDGPARAELEARHPGVYFPGFKTGVDLARHIAAADVFVFPSRTDTFGLVMLEAMACGVPVAAYPVTGPKQLVQEGENGCLHENLMTAIKSAMRLSPDKCRAFAKGYSWENCSKQFFNNLALLHAANDPVTAVISPRSFPGTLHNVCLNSTGKPVSCNELPQPTMRKS